MIPYIALLATSILFYRKFRKYLKKRRSEKMIDTYEDIMAEAQRVHEKEKLESPPPATEK